MCLLKDKETYLTLFQKLTSKVPGLQLYLQGYCTDSEKALRNALAQEFPRALQFLCYIHVKRNISEKCLSKFSLSRQLTNTILMDIFSESGLVSCQSLSSYNDMVRQLKAKWDLLEDKERVGTAKFSKYFEKCKEKDILYHMLPKTVQDAGFGGNLQSTNVPESLNAKIKRWQNFQPSDMSNFIEDMKSLIDKQTDDVNRAYLGMPSPYVVREEFSKKESLDLFKINSPEQRQAAIQARRIVVDKDLFQSVKKYVPYGHIPEIINEDNESISSFSGSVQFGDEGAANEAQPPKVSKVQDEFQDLHKIFSAVEVRNLCEKAQGLVPEGVLKGFTNDTFFVKSSSGSSHHNVTVHKKSIVCDKGCLGFGTRKICAHSLAVAIYQGTSRVYQVVCKG